MRIARPITFAGSIALLIALVSGCTSPMAPVVTRAPAAPLSAHPAIYLQSSVQRMRLLASLHSAGIRTTNSTEEADYVLTVIVGKRRVKMQCGGMHNIIYILSDMGRQLMEIKARGLTGECVPNVFDETSQTLASYFGG
ncbi:MAG: hypothetical protein JRF15_10875 [Deltaproteobacteria bacterium]|jgi:hypothetical protein|nr:hypothetical protein [Deltaproteobacteria bacterium]